jgi:CubicO group peptidase (beta-lactamase class C family)
MSQKFFKSILALSLIMVIIITPEAIPVTGLLKVQARTQVQEESSDKQSSEAVYAEAETIARETSEAIVSEYGATSIQYALIDDGEIVISDQVGVYSKKTGEKPSNSNMYGIGSISKTFTAVAIMQLVEQGKVKLDVPITEYIPEFTMKDSRYKEITVRMLLNHTSGLMGNTITNNILFQGKYSSPYNDLLNSLKNATLKAAPGKFATYCNDGYTLAELIVQKVSNMSFSSYIKKNISQAISLQNTETPADKFDMEKLVNTYLEGTDIRVPYETCTTIGEGGMYSTAEDLCQFAQIFMEGSTAKVLSQTSVKEMANAEYKKGVWPEEDYSMESYGLGWDCVDMGAFEQYGIEALYKGGSTQFYKSALIILPRENMAMAVISTGGVGAFNELMAKNVLLSYLKAKGTINEIIKDKTFEKPVAAAMPEELTKFEGMYSNNQTLFKVEISKKGKLSLIENPDMNKNKETYLYIGDNKFCSPDGSGYFSFVVNRGITYLYYNSCSTLEPFNQIEESGYLAQKMTQNKLSLSIANVWKKRAGKRYFVVSEQYNSQVYVYNSQLGISLLKSIDGYCNYGTITGKNTAKTMVQIPGALGRDLNELNFYSEGKKQYLDFNGTKLISEDSIKTLPTTEKLTVKLDGKDCSKWYKISKTSTNKMIKVKLPKNTSFAVYDANGSITSYSYIMNETVAQLPQNGYVVFIGDHKAVEIALEYIEA